MSGPGKHDGPDLRRELALAGSVCGVDEVGRGPLAGPVVAAAVILDPARVPEGIDDSKRLSAKRRAALAEAIRASAQIGIGWAEVAEIDRVNIRQASHRAMERAVAALPIAPATALIDGNALPEDLPCAAEAIVGGDRRSLSIAAASIIAKVHRDRMMAELARAFPGYGWERNAGYGTAEHLAALDRLGPTPHHRRSFAPIHKILCKKS
ncbi:MAG: ribonuclease HII [Pseudomonadota bacterium]